MNKISTQREKIRQLRALASATQTDQQYLVKQVLLKNQIELALRVLQVQLESRIQGHFDPIVSQKIDAIQVLLND